MRDRVVDGRAIRRIREAHGMTRNRLADDSHVSLSRLKDIELSDAQPSDVIAHAIARALKVDVDEFTRPRSARAS